MPKKIVDIKKLVNQVSVDPKFWKQKVVIETDLLMVLSIHGNLCLALRHPQNRGPARALILNFIRILENELVKFGVLTLDQVKQIHKVETEEGSPDLR